VREGEAPAQPRAIKRLRLGRRFTTDQITKKAARRLTRGLQKRVMRFELTTFTLAKPLDDPL